MLLKVSIFVIGLFAGSALSASVDCNIETCAKPLKIYEELGCKAIFGSRSCCAKRFECQDFKKLDDNKCTFEGKEYNVGEILPRNDTDDTKCLETCFCTRQDNEPAKFTCSNSDCGVTSFKVPGCINLYGDLNECCSTSIVCDEDEKASLASCFVGKEYREGEKFIPQSNPCYECLCHKDFDNSTIAANPHCRKLNCQIDLRYKSFVQRGCLPVFHSEKCCPVDWECPKHGKKIIKREANQASDDDESQTKKQDVYIVTPSKNLEGYLDEVKSSNEEEILTTEAPVTTPIASSTSEEVSPTEAPIVKSSTEETSLPTLSSNPFVAPSDEVTVPVYINIDEVTTESLKALEVPEVSTESIQTTQEPTTTSEILPIVLSTEAPSTEKASETTQASTEPATVAVTTEEPTTTTIKAKAESDESEGSKESEESAELNTNLFGEEVEDDKKEENVTTVPSSTEPVTSEAVTIPSTVVTSAAPETTEALREALKTLEQPEELTTLVEESTTILTTKAVPLISTEATLKEEPTAEITLLTYEVLKHAPSTEVPITSTVTQEPLSPAQSTFSTIAEVSPTEFEKLLTTLREFVAKADSVASTEAAPTTPVQIVPQLVEQQIEFVNFTVSSEKHNEETKSISKRSIPDADLIPRYFKQHYSSNKDRGCAFNGRSFKVGEVITTDNDCLKCICEYAPIGHCVLKEKCNL